MTRLLTEEERTLLQSKGLGDLTQSEKARIRDEAELRERKRILDHQANLRSGETPLSRKQRRKLEAMRRKKP